MHAAETSVPSSDRSRWLALAGIGIASFLGCIDFTIVNTALPAIRQELRAPVAQTEWLVTAFVMALSAFMVAAGRLADQRGRRRMLYAGMAVFALASLGAGLAGGMAALIGWRLLQGLACAALYTSSAATVAALFPAPQRGRALGLLFAVNGLGLAIGPVAGGLLVGTLGWRSVFLLNVPLIALAFVLCLGRVTESRDEAADRRFDWLGLLLLATGLPCLLLALGQGERWGWRSAPTLGLALAGLALLAVFGVVEQRVRAPLLRLSLLANRPLAAAGLANFSLAFFYCAAFFLMPWYLGSARGQGSAATGWLLLPATALMALASPLAGRAADRRGPLPVLACGFELLALSALLQSRFTADSAWATVLLAFAAMGLGWGCILGPSMALALAAVPPAQGGTATGAVSTIHNFGGALGLSLAGLLQRAVAGQALDAAAPEGAAFLAGYQAAMLLLLAVCLATLAALWALRPRPARARVAA